MIRLLLIAAAAAAAVAAPRHATDRNCLIAWNAPANRAARTKLLTDRPFTGLALRAGISGTDTWKRGTPPRETSTAACILTEGRLGRIRMVIGPWRAGGVGHWSFRRAIPVNQHVLSNVRLLADGRVTKIYGR